MNHTKQDRLDALLVSAQIIQRQCKFAQIYIENFPLHGGFNVVVFDDKERYLKYHFSKDISIDENDETFANMEEMASIIETSLSQKYYE